MLVCTRSSKNDNLNGWEGQVASFTESIKGAMYQIEATGKLQMVVLNRTRKEFFTTMVDREAKRQDLKVVVNGSFMGLSLVNKAATYLNITADPLDPSESYPIGEVIKEGKQIAGSSSPKKFFFSQNTCGLDRFSAGEGDPPSSSCGAVGGLAPMVVNGTPYGPINTYSRGVPSGAPLTGDVDPKYKKYLLKKGNAMFDRLLGNGALMGKVAVGYSSSKQKLLIVVQADGDARGLNLEKVRTIFTIASMDNAVLMDCSNSATLWYDGKFQVRPSQHKDDYLNVAVGFK